MAEGLLIAVGSDHAGLNLKRAVVKALGERGHEVLDLGTDSAESVDYPDFAHAVAAKVVSGDAPLGVLICGSGIGMSLSANRHPGVRAVVCSDTFSARMARMHNDANVLCMGERVVGEGLALDILDAFLGASFEGGRHARRVGKIEL
ncbi:MAG: ribose 5-phosphate isomerase B [Deltaproteobacteria bacterium]|nr:MAG: ribose 5-phosphate isomerase B [Deltaproteobacteria bacterium]